MSRALGPRRRGRLPPDLEESITNRNKREQQNSQNDLRVWSAHDESRVFSKRSHQWFAFGQCRAKRVREFGCPLTAVYERHDVLRKAPVVDGLRPTAVASALAARSPHAAALG